MLNYVRPGLVPLVGAAGVVLVALGLLPPLGLLNAKPAGHGGGSGGRHHHRGRVGWLLLVPVLVVLLVQPAALGSYAVSSRSVIPGGGDGQFPPLTAPVRGAVPMSMAEFETRAVRDPSQSLAGVRVRLVGFAAPAEGDAGGYRLTRFVIFCCAADAEALQAVVAGDPTRGPGTSGWRSREPGCPARPPSTTRAHPRPCSRPIWSIRSPSPARRTSTQCSSAAERHCSEGPATSPAPHVVPSPGVRLWAGHVDQAGSGARSGSSCRRPNCSTTASPAPSPSGRTRWKNGAGAVGAPAGQRSRVHRPAPARVRHQGRGDKGAAVGQPAPSTPSRSGRSRTTSTSSSRAGPRSSSPIGCPHPPGRSDRGPRAGPGRRAGQPRRAA